MHEESGPLAALSGLFCPLQEEINQAHRLFVCGFHFLLNRFPHGLCVHKCLLVKAFPFILSFFPPAAMAAFCHFFAIIFKKAVFIKILLKAPFRLSRFRPDLRVLSGVVSSGHGSGLLLFFSLGGLILA